METPATSHRVVVPLSDPLSSALPPPVLSQDALDSILDVACTDTWLEDFLNMSPPTSMGAGTPTTVAMATTPLDQGPSSALSSSETVREQELSSPWQLPSPAPQQEVNGKNDLGHGLL